ncbi:hypothetical protein RUND412_004642 [Rhizina undulata]
MKFATPPPLFTVFLLRVLTASAQNGTSFRRGLLQQHNEFRQQHSVASLIWDENLAEYAEAHEQKLKDNPLYGENLAIGYPDAVTAVNGWIAERPYYDYFAGRLSPEAGNFTQDYDLIKTYSTNSNERRIMKSTGDTLKELKDNAS